MEGEVPPKHQALRGPIHSLEVATAGPTWKKGLRAGAMTGHFFSREGLPHHFSLSYHPCRKGPQSFPAMALVEKASGEQGS